MGTVWKNLVLDPLPDGQVALTIVLGTMTQDHADRYVDFFRRTMIHQQVFFEHVLSADLVG